MTRERHDGAASDVEGDDICLIAQVLLAEEPAALQDVRARIPRRHGRFVRRIKEPRVSQARCARALDKYRINPGNVGKGDNGFAFVGYDKRTGGVVVWRVGGGRSPQADARYTALSALRVDEPATTTFPRTPSFAWKPVRGAVRYEFELATSPSFNDGSMIDVFPVHKDGSRIGKVTSACFSPRLEKNIGYAMVPIEHSELGTEFEVERPDGTASAVVVEKPFIDPKKETPKQQLATGQGT